MKKSNDLDDLNMQRVETTKLRVAHAIKLVSNPAECLYDGRVIDDAAKSIAHAVNLLESGEEEMRWACSHFEWDTGICDQLNEACAKLGRCLAQLVDTEVEDFDPTLAGCEAKDAISDLGKAIASLVRWNDDEQDVSEV